MASDISYVITQSNNKTEKAAINYLLEKDSSFLNPTKSGRKRIMELLQLPRKYSRAFDLFKVPGSINSENEIVVSNVSEIQLIELKTTKKHLPNNPRGFFFGATENEFNIAKFAWSTIQILLCMLASGFTVL